VSNLILLYSSFFRFTLLGQTAFYVTAVQVANGTIVGQLPARGTKERFGLVFQQGNSLRTCVNRAIDRLWRNGTIKSLQRRWLARVGGARELK
jgi:polar amino acid transport system substrate-binding protein